MDNAQKHAILDTRHTTYIHTNQKHNTENQQDEQHRLHKKNEDEPGLVLSSYYKS